VNAGSVQLRKAARRKLVLILSHTVAFTEACFMIYYPDDLWCNVCGTDYISRGCTTSNAADFPNYATEQLFGHAVDPQTD